MRVLVMGGTQFNGRALVDELVRAGHEVTICNRGRTPAETMDGLWTGELVVGSGVSSPGMDIRPSATSERVAASPRAAMLRQRFQLAQIVPHLAPNIWWWNRSVVFDIDRVRTDIGWEPRHDLRSMFEHTFDWYQRSGRAEADATDLDWSLEDAVLQHVR